MKFNVIKAEYVFFQMQTVSLKNEFPSSRYKLFNAENFIKQNNFHNMTKKIKKYSKITKLSFIIIIYVIFKTQLVALKNEFYSSSYMNFNLVMS